MTTLAFCETILNSVCLSVCLLLVRAERPQSAETRSRRPHAGHRPLPGGEAAVARPALHAALPLQTALRRLPVEDTNSQPRRSFPYMFIMFIKNVNK